jgi:hypothetical protein
MFCLPESGKHLGISQHQFFRLKRFLDVPSVAGEDAIAPHPPVKTLDLKMHYV